MLGSLAVHAGLAVALVWLSELRGRAPLPLDAVVVELVGAPGAAAAAPAAPPAPAPEPEPQTEPEGVTVETREPAATEPLPTATPRPSKPSPTPRATPAPTSRPASGATTGPQPPGTPAGGGETTGSASAGATVSALEGGDAAFGWYRASVTNALYQHWRRPVLSGLREPIEVRVAFEIMRDGNVRGLRIEGASGVPSLDRSALRAVSDAAPLPPLPATMREPYLPASFVFRLYPEGF